MKRLFILLLLIGPVFCYGQLDSENEKKKDEVRTVFGNTKPSGGHIGFTSKGFYINGQQGYGNGVELAVGFGRKFNFGFSGYGLITDVKSSYSDVSGVDYFYDLGYGGFYLEPIIGSIWPIHLSFPVTLGLGGVFQSQYRAYNYNWDTMSYGEDYAMFYIADIGANIELNLFKFLRLAGGINYRFTSDVNLQGTPKQQFSGLGANITLKLGWF